jgi:hypothetical protein
MEACLWGNSRRRRRGKETLLTCEENEVYLVCTYVFHKILFETGEEKEE